MMVFVYAFLPILKNTYTGIMSVDPKNIEVARGIGLSRWKCLFEIEIPIAAPFIMSGIRIAAVAAVGTMTIAAFAGAKGLGWFINLGLNSLNYQLILLGAVSALALLVDFIFGRLERAITSEGLLAPEQIKNKSEREKKREKAAAFLLCGMIILVSALYYTAA
ncbi:MAG: ABC transporter permease [Clostridium sp.]